MGPLVRLENVTKVYRVGEQDVPALRDVSLSVQTGEYVAIMGASGSGKSTLLNLLGCLDRPSWGRYWLGGQDVSRMSDRQLSHARNRKIGFIFQSFNLISPLTVLANIEVPLFYQGMPRRARRRRSGELAELVGLETRLAHRSSQLSGGQQQRVAIARALASDPLVLLADEPTGNLDSRTSLEILRLLEDLHRRGRAIVMVTHEDEVAARAQRVVCLKDGQVEWDRPQPAGGPP